MIGVYAGKDSAPKSVSNITQVLCSTSAARFANTEQPIENVMFWTTTQENVQLYVIRVTRSVGDTRLTRELRDVYVCVCVCVCVC